MSEIVKLSEAYISRNHVVAKVVDQYGDERTIYKSKGGSLRIKNRDDNSVALKMNRVAGKLIGAKIKIRRLEADMTLDELCKRAGLRSQTPKQQMWQIENAVRKEGVRIGTLYAIAAALDCDIRDIMPSPQEVMKAAGVQFGSGKEKLR